MHWNKVTSGERGTDWNGFIQSIKALPKRILWRHNVSGDLVGSNDAIDAQALKDLVKANANKSGFTYTHYPMISGNNIQAVKHANDNGFTVNLSANDLNQADDYKALNIGPVAVIVPEHTVKVSFTPKGNKVVVCPAQTSEKVTCSSCTLCQKVDRDYIIGFRVHGTYKKKAGIALEL
jgi:ethanolamine utilization protein EutA (predicted chaperonin)